MEKSEPPVPPVSPRSWYIPLLLVLAVALFYGRLLLGWSLYSGDTFFFALGQKSLIREQLLACRLPIMDPYILCGVPLLEDIVAGVLYPLNVLLLCGTPLWGFHLFAVAHYGLAALAMYALLRVGLAAHPLASLAAAFAYAAGGYLWGVIDRFFFMAAPWVPLFFLGVLRVSQAPISRSRKRWLGLTVVALALLLYCGNFQQACDATVFALLLWVAVSCGRSSQAGGWQRAARGGLWLLAGGLSALLLAAPQLVPTIVATLRSYRAGGLSLEEASAWSFPPVRLIEYLIPFFFGAQQQGYGLALTRFYQGGTVWTPCVFVGVPLLAAAVVSWPTRARLEAGWCLAVAAIGLLLALGRYTPTYAAAHAVVPGFALFRHPEKYLFWVHFGLVTAGALGLSRTVSEPAAARRAERLSWAFAALGGVLILALTSAFLGWRSSYTGLVRTLGSEWSIERFVTWQALQAAGATFAAAAFAWSIRRGAGRNQPWLLGWAPVVLTVVHLLALGGLITWAIPVRLLHEIEPVANVLPADHHALFRIYSEQNITTPLDRPVRRQSVVVGDCLHAYLRMIHNVPAIFRVRTLQGFSPIMDRGYADFIDFRKRNPQAVMNLLSVKYIIVDSTVQVDSLPPGTRVLVVNRTDGFALLANVGALPRIHTASRFVQVPEEQALDTVFDLAAAATSRTDTARRGPPGVGTGTQDAPPQQPGSELAARRPIVVSALPEHFVDGAPPATAAVDVLRDLPGRIAVRCTGPAWLVLRDWWYPGWHAVLDRHTPVEITRADAKLMAVFVPVGEHRVDFHYRPIGLILGSMLGGAGLVLCLVWGLWPGMQRLPGGRSAAATLRAGTS